LLLTTRQLERLDQAVPFMIVKNKRPVFHQAPPVTAAKVIPRDFPDVQD
jgi:hypothetical protein